MRVILDGNINSLYVQSLCMIFFRGEKFSLNEENPRGEIKVSSVCDDFGVKCCVSLCYDGKKSTNEQYEAFSNLEKRERTVKIVTGKAIYFACNEITGYLPPWGLLTGIRPSYVAMELINEYGREEAFNILVKKYLLSKEKANLAITVAENEGLILNQFDENTCSLYISIPFCPTRCSYCSFISYASPKLFQLIPNYVERLCDDIRNILGLIKKLKLKLVSVYIGGGTPTILDENQLEKILSTIRSNIDLSNLIEFTLEGGRPDTITIEKLNALKNGGVNRISVNPQSLNDDVLQKIGRNHSVQQFYDSFELVNKFNFDVVNTDLIAGLDGDSFESFKSTIDKIVELGPKNITVHSFSVKKSAQILCDNRDIYNVDGADAIKSVEYANKRLIECGYVPYYMYRQKNTISDLENVGYAKHDSFGIYNVLMMGDGHTVFGVGAGATTKLIKKIDGKTEINRIFSAKYPYEYLQDNQNHNSEILDFFKGGPNDEEN